MARIVILPGTDGTGSLLADFVAALGMESLVISYPTGQVLGYEQLAEFVRPQLPTSESYILLGESFGGPLAISLAAEHSLCAGIILCASFAHYASPLRALAPLAAFVPIRLIPLSVISWFLLGRWSTPNLRVQLAHALSTVSPSVLRARVLAALRVNATPKLRALGIPVLYLQACHDRVVPVSVGRSVVSSTPRATLVQLPGPHFLLQAAPQACAAEVRRWVGC